MQYLMYIIDACAYRYLYVSVDESNERDLRKKKKKGVKRKIN